MATLRSIQLTASDGGYIPTAKGATVNGVLLGEPTLLGIDPITLAWDDAALPSGSVEIVDDVPIVTPDETTS